MEFHPIRLREPLIIPKELDDNFLFMVDSSLVQLWPQMVDLCEKEKLSLQEATEQMAILDPLHLGMPEWYSYKMRSLLRAHFVHDEVPPRNVIIYEGSGVDVIFTADERCPLGLYLLAYVTLAFF